MRRGIVCITVICAATTLTAQAASAKPTPTSQSLLVQAKGSISGAPGSRTSTLSLSPAAIALHPQDRLGWKDRDNIQEQHLWVFTTDSSKVVGRAIDDGKPCPLCDTAAQEMAAALNNDPSVTRVEHGKAGGLDAEGDAYLLRLGDDVWVKVLAPAGTTLYYMDAYHPWQHGEVDVS